MRQRKLGSHTPPCHRRMVITTLFSVLLAALRRRPGLYHTRWLLTAHAHACACARGGGGMILMKQGCSTFHPSDFLDVRQHMLRFLLLPRLGKARLVVSAFMKKPQLQGKERRGHALL